MLPMKSAVVRAPLRVYLMRTGGDHLDPAFEGHPDRSAEVTPLTADLPVQGPRQSIATNTFALKAANVCVIR